LIFKGNKKDGSQKSGNFHLALRTIFAASQKIGDLIEGVLCGDFVAKK